MPLVWKSPVKLLEEIAEEFGLPIPIPEEHQEKVLRRIASVSLAGEGSFRVVARLLGFKQSDTELRRIFEEAPIPIERPPWAR